MAAIGRHLRIVERPAAEVVDAAIRDSRERVAAMADDVDDVSSECLALASELAGVTPIRPR